MGLLNLPSQINSFRKEFPSAAESVGLWLPVDSRFNGDWSLVERCEENPFEVGELSESSAKDPPNVDLALTLKIGPKTAQGSVLSAGLSKYHAYPEAMMTGLPLGSKLKLRVFDWIGGKPKTLAMIELYRWHDDCLELVTTNQQIGYFPDRAILSRQPNGYFEKLPRNGGLMEKVIQRMLQDKRSGTKKVR